MIALKIICKRKISQRLHKNLHITVVITYLTLPAGWMPVVRQARSAEATAQAQCATPTDLKVGRTS